MIHESMCYKAPILLVDVRTMLNGTEIWFPPRHHWFNMVSNHAVTGITLCNCRVRFETQEISLGEYRSMGQHADAGLVNDF